ncbi:MAG: hypothetical protein Q4Q03_04910, partial [Bowdeniella nasicola]|nr:hypothetical protein [Bowdeniella nasicola]
MWTIILVVVALFAAMWLWGTLTEKSKVAKRVDEAADRAATKVNRGVVWIYLVVLVILTISATYFAITTGDARMGLAALACGGYAVYIYLSDEPW